jgi:hypothetical protein
MENSFLTPMADAFKLLLDPTCASNGIAILCNAWVREEEGAGLGWEGVNLHNSEFAQYRSLTTVLNSAAKFKECKEVPGEKSGEKMVLPSLLCRRYVDLINDV